jgi:hypothetical protein
LFKNLKILAQIDILFGHANAIVATQKKFLAMPWCVETQKVAAVLNLGKNWR